MRRLVAVLALLLLAAPAPALAGQERSLEIRSFDTRIVVEKDGTLDITERIDAHFTGSWNGIYRVVPLSYRNGAGLNWSVRIELVGATDQDGTPLRTEVEFRNTKAKFKMWVPGAHDASRSVVLHYRIRNGLRFFEEHDELYWNATGDEWDVPLGQVTAEVVLPDGASGVRATAFNGAYGATATEAEIGTAGSTLRFTMPRELEFREGLTVVVGWDKGLITPPTAAEKVSEFFASNWPLLLPLPVFALMFFLWNSRGRDPRRRPVAVQYEAPTGMTPAEVGTLTDESVDMRDITATLVDLAVRGYIKIAEIDAGKFLGITFGEDFAFHRLKPESSWSDLALHERRVLEGIFKGRGSVVELSDLKNEFYSAIGGIKDGVMQRLVTKGFYGSRPDHVRAKWVAVGVALGVAIAFVGTAMGARVGLSPVATVLAGALSGIIIIAFGWNMPARTEAGTRALERVLGLGEFIGRVEKDSLERVKRTPEMFETFLPYAMALGLERQWSKAFKDLQLQPPSWYVGRNPMAFNPTHFTQQLGVMSSQAGSAMTSQPRSSSGSGFSGGGSSGGGGGGGGGGGF
jgi:uncharacterized membrane protein YgcG